MEELIQTQIEHLSNPKAGWVTRRDAAEALGRLAAQSVRALLAHRNDEDKDVKAAVVKELNAIGVSGEPSGEATVLMENPPEYSFDALIGELAYREKRVVTREGSGCRVELTIDENRKQTVHVMPYEDSDGAAMIRVYTRCGTATPAAIQWTLRRNARLLDCAFALLNEQDGEKLILISNIERIYATPNRVKAVVKEIARYGDYLERKLSSEDVH